MAAVFSGLNTTQLHRTNAAAADWLQSLINADGFVSAHTLQVGKHTARHLLGD